MAGHFGDLSTNLLIAHSVAGRLVHGGPVRGPQGAVHSGPPGKQDAIGHEPAQHAQQAVAAAAGAPPGTGEMGVCGFPRLVKRNVLFATNLMNSVYLWCSLGAVALSRPLSVADLCRLH